MQNKVFGVSLSPDQKIRWRRKLGLKENSKSIINNSSYSSASRVVEKNK
jgi:hypothetical protein